MRALTVVLILLAPLTVFAQDWWADEVIYQAPESVGYRVAADLNGDGIDDLVTVTSDQNQIHAWINPQQEAIPWTSYEVEDYFQVKMVYPVDWDGDGADDLIVRYGLTQILSLFLNTDGDGTAWTKVNLSLTPGTTSSRIQVGDVDGDGDGDLIYALSDHPQHGPSLIWAKNLGGEPDNVETFFVATQLSEIGPMTLADFDGDGDLDLVTSEPASGQLAWLEYFGFDGEWDRHEVAINIVAEEELHVVDINGDGLMDIAGVAKPEDLRRICWWEQGAHEVFTQHAIPSEGGHSALGSMVMVWDDLDMDNDLDLLGRYSIPGNIDNHYFWWENLNGDGLTWSEQELGIGVYERPCAGDFDGDGRTDIEVGIGAFFLTWMRNTGDPGTTWEIHAISEPGGMGNVGFGDLNGDSNADIISGDTQGLAWISSNNNLDPEFTFHTPVIDNYSHAQFTPFDIDDDGDADLLASAMPGFGSWRSWFENVDGSGLTLVQHPLEGDDFYPQFIAFADLDNDGDIDQMGQTQWWENVDGFDGYWPQHPLPSLPPDGFALAFHDLNEDGLPDYIAGADYNGALYVVMNNGDVGSDDWPLAQFGANTDTDRLISVDVADMDGDGDLDLCGSISHTYWWENGHSWLAHVALMNPPGDDEYTVQPADMDGDGDMDLVGTRYQGGHYHPTWWMNENGGTTWDMQIIAETLAWQPILISPVDLNGDGLLDALGYYPTMGRLTWWENGNWLGVDEGQDGSSTPPQTFSLSPAYPNPFNASTRFSVTLPVAGFLTVRVVDLLGREVAALTEGDYEGGVYDWTWQPQGVSSGFYMVQAVAAGQGVATTKLLLIK